MRRLSAKHGLKLHEPYPDIVDLPKGAVGQIGNPTIMILEPRRKLSIGEKFRGPVIVYPDAPDDPIPLHSIGELIPCTSLPVMIVSLTATGQHIRDEVDRVLRAREKTKGLHLTTEANPITRSLRSGHAIAEWQRKSIVELVEMLAWRQSPTGQQYPKHLIGRWIDPEKLGTPKETSEAIAAARQAIAILPEIMAEVNKAAL